MAKQKGAPGVQNRHIYSRVSYLYQAASYLAQQGPQSLNNNQVKEESGTVQASSQDLNKELKATQHVSRQTLTDMRAVSLKAQIRLGSDLKRTVCKFCDTLLIEGKTSHSVIENPSRGGKKPWADVLAITCETCGRTKRYPVHMPRQERRPFRPVGDTSKDGQGDKEKQTPREGLTGVEQKYKGG